MALKKEKIIEEALELLNENGLEGVTLRKLAKRLNVYASALYWHVKNKEALVNEMAETLLQKEFPEIKQQKKNESWQDWLIRLLNKLRNALLSYADGARVVAGSQLSLMMAKLTEEAISVLVNANISLERSRLIVLTATRYTFGFVTEEQISPSSEELKSVDTEKFKKQFPLMMKGAEEYLSSGKTMDDIYTDGLKVIVGIK